MIEQIKKLKELMQDQNLGLEAAREFSDEIVRLFPVHYIVDNALWENSERYEQARSEIHDHIDDFFDRRIACGTKDLTESWNDLLTACQRVITAVQANEQECKRKSIKWLEAEAAIEKLEERY